VVRLGIHGLPRLAAVTAHTDGRPIHEGRHHALTHSGWIEHETARRFGAAFRLRGAEAPPCFSLVVGAIKAPIAEVNPKRAGCGIYRNAAQAAETRCLSLEKVAEHRLPSALFVTL